KDGVLWTAPLDELILPGISRAHLIRACKALDIPVREEPYYLEQLRAADEILVTSSSKLVVHADKLDGQPCGMKDPVTFEKIRKYMLDEFTQATE
ncbi:MAG: aminotransferase class IV, partial [Firmicutes bacterium]|nr:aminotransferase class IV [Bacillota bacterium]